MFGFVRVSSSSAGGGAEKTIGDVCANGGEREDNGDDDDDDDGKEEDDDDDEEEEGMDSFKRCISSSPSSGSSSSAEYFLTLPSSIRLSLSSSCSLSPPSLSLGCFSVLCLALPIFLHFSLGGQHRTQTQMTVTTTTIPIMAGRTARRIDFTVADSLVFTSSSLTLTYAVV